MANHSLKDRRRVLKPGGTFTDFLHIESLIAFTSTAVDGISSDAILSFAGQNDEPAAFTVDIIKLFEVLAKAVVGFLE